MPGDSFGGCLNSRFLFLALLLVGCGQPFARVSQPRAVAEDGRMVYGALPKGPTDREILNALPSGATYRWGLPGAHFAGTLPGEDSASQAFAAQELRLAASEVLRLNGWREAGAGETAQFELAVAEYVRSSEWYETQADPRAQLPDPRTCENRPMTQRAICVEPLPRVFPPVQVLQTGTDSQFAFAIMRTADRATAWWIAPRRIDIQRLTLELLHAGSTGGSTSGTALDP